ncbi:hypothetical protein HU200_020865 [Digitaria exilis]|uniref:Uncharacterized protein n=1 Tax=Digitaria exilis TaxID=1010633 RepID=A0A835F0L4_9POAL|nr:hypothetical protein HU200_020865 [Digitaria exilis]
MKLETQTGTLSNLKWLMEKKWKLFWRMRSLGS